jgi:hypothetical protein
MDEQTEAVADTRPCTCHPADNPPVPCPRQFAVKDCRRVAVLRETQKNIIAIKSRDQNVAPNLIRFERELLDYMMRVRDALEY